MTHKKKILSLAKTRSKEAQDPIRKFILSISSPATLNGYKKSFAEFLRSVEEFDGTFEEMAMQFYEHAMSNPEEIQNILEDYAMYNSNRSREPTDSENYLNPSCFRNKLKGIKKFCKVNHIPLHWDDIYQYKPADNNKKPTRGYTTEEIRQILECSTSTQMDFVILAMASCGARAGEWEELLWEQIFPIYGDNGKYSFKKEDLEKPQIVCASMVVYAGTSEEYITLISIEAYDKLEAVRKQWTKRMKRTPQGNDHILLTRHKTPRPFSRDGIRIKLTKLVSNAGFRTKEKWERTYDCPATHGFRKRDNKIAVETTDKNGSHADHIRKERLLGHKTAISNLEQSYFFSDILESVPQYLKIMPELMVTEGYKAKWKLQKVQKKNMELEQTIKEKDSALEMVNELKAKVRRIEKYQLKAD